MINMIIEEFIYDGIDAFELMEKLEKNATKNYYKTYYLKDKDWIKNQSKNWHENNKERLKELRAQTVMCVICQKPVRKYYRSRHEKGVVHELLKERLKS
jgi:UTP-glucose-1-phosphate uridylyltransferase